MAYQGIGLIGLGSITNVHAAGYSVFHLPVVAGYAPNPVAREKFMQRCPNVTVHTTLE